MTEFADIQRVLGIRSAIGIGYKNPGLEARRLEAIRWLRTQSRAGWLRDRVMKK